MVSGEECEHVSQRYTHDIKLELDVRCQKLIEKTLRTAYPRIAILGEEGVLGDTEADHRWVVDPIDGTVNFSYGIPHCCVSIALQARILKHKVRSSRREVHTHSDAAYAPRLKELRRDAPLEFLYVLLHGLTLLHGQRHI